MSMIQAPSISSLTKLVGMVLLGGTLSCSQIDERRQEIYDSMSPEVQGFFDGVQEKSIAAANTTGDFLAEQYDNVSEDIASGEFVENVRNIKLVSEEDIAAAKKFFSNMTIDGMVNYLPSTSIPTTKLPSFTSIPIATEHANDVSVDASYRLMKNNKPVALVARAMRETDNGVAIYGSGQQGFVDELSQTYHVVTKDISSDDELCPFVQDYTGASLLVIIGHGSEDGIRLSYGIDNIERTWNMYENSEDWNDFEQFENAVDDAFHERRSINTNDQEMKTCYDFLAPDAVIFLESCGMAKYGLVDQVHNMSGRTTIGATESFAAMDVAINKPMPLDVTISTYDDDFNRIDVTYVRK